MQQESNPIKAPVPVELTLNDSVFSAVEKNERVRGREIEGDVQ